MNRMSEDVSMTPKAADRGCPLRPRVLDRWLSDVRPADDERVKEGQGRPGVIEGPERKMLLRKKVGGASAWRLEHGC